MKKSLSRPAARQKQLDGSRREPPMKKSQFCRRIIAENNYWKERIQKERKKSRIRLEGWKKSSRQKQQNVREESQLYESKYQKYKTAYAKEKKAAGKNGKELEKVQAEYRNLTTRYDFLCKKVVTRYQKALRDRNKAYEEIKEELKKARSQETASPEEKYSPLECKICLLTDVTRVFGCGHVACDGCLASLNRCHICRAEIKKVRRIFL